MTKLKRVEMKLRRAIEAALEEGWGLATGDFFPLSRFGIAKCCAVGALYRKGVVYDADDGRLMDTCLSFDDDDLDCVAGGFDGSISVDPDNKYYQIGARLRRDYYETTDEVVK